MTEVSTQEPSLDEKKKYIIAGAKKLNREDLIDIGKLINRNGCGSNLKYSASGTHISLDKLGDKSDIIIPALYAQIRHKLAH